MDENLNNDDNIVKIDLTKPPKSEEQVESKEETSNAEQEPVENDAADETGVVGSDENTEPAPEQEKVQAESETQELAALEEVTEEEAEEEAQEVVEEIK